MHVNILTIFILVQAKYNSKEPIPTPLKLNQKSRWGKEKLIVDFSLKLIGKKCGLYIIRVRFI